MQIFSKTTKGSETVLERDFPLPRKFKALLLAIDGKTDISIFERNLDAFGDVRAMLHTLQKEGLITPINSATDSKPLKTAREIANPVEARESISELLPARDKNLAMRAVPSRFSKSQQNVSAYVDQHQTLHAAVNAMELFLLTNWTDDFDWAIKEIKEIDSIKQLAQMWGRYKTLVQPLGEIGQAHLSEMRQILKKI